MAESTPLSESPNFIKNKKLIPSKHLRRKDEFRGCS